MNVINNIDFDRVLSDQLLLIYKFIDINSDGYFKPLETKWDREAKLRAFRDAGNTGIYYPPYFITSLFK